MVPHPQNIIHINNDMNINIHIDINMNIDINIHIDINMNIDIHSIINMNIEYSIIYYLLTIRYSQLAIPYWLFPIRINIIDIRIWPIASDPPGQPPPLRALTRGFEACYALAHKSNSIAAQ